LLTFLEHAWTEPDEGIWEIRGTRRHFTHSKIMAWVAMDRGIKSIEQFGLEGPLDRWRTVREAIHKDVCTRGFSGRLNSFVQSYDGEELDAALLMIPLVGFLPSTDPRVASTICAIEKHLMTSGFLSRYGASNLVDGLPPGEGAFLPCTFWLADSYVLLNRQSDAEQLFERLLGVCNDVGLLSEEYDPIARRLIGNFPQALSHIAIINTATNLSRSECCAKQRSKS